MCIVYVSYARQRRKMRGVNVGQEFNNFVATNEPETLFKGTTLSSFYMTSVHHKTSVLNFYVNKVPLTSEVLKYYVVY